jgi:hypothetical protein
MYPSVELQQTTNKNYQSKEIIQEIEMELEYNIKTSNL